MSVLAVPDGGLHLESSESSEFLPVQAFGITLNDSVIEDMINCVQNGNQIELFLGNNPSLQYGDYEEPLNPAAESSGCDLFLTNLNESKYTAQRLQHPTMSILKSPPTSSKPTKPQIRVEKAGPSKGGKGSKAKLPHGKSAMSQVFSGSSTTRSLPTSPALTGVASPSHNPAFAASQQQLEKNKGQRSTLVHELAIGDQTFDYLKAKWSGAEGDLNNTLSKVADKMGPKYSMKKIYWKELDVWNYNYEPAENRQKAIENAKKQYDKQRLETKDPAWERLLEEKDRGKGIILSKLQAAIAEGRKMAPTMKGPKADDASSKNSSDESVKGKAGGEAMARSNSQPVGSKPKKVSDREALSKSLLSKPMAAKKAAPTAKKAAPVSKTTKAPDKGGKKFLSEEFVQDSSSDDEAPLANTTTTSKAKPAERSVEKQAEKVAKPRERSPAPAPKVKERSPAVVPKPKERSPPPVSKPKTAKPTIRAPRPALPTARASSTNTIQKRPRDEDDSSSSSGAPLSKRVKPKETTTTKPLPNNTTTLKHRPSDASQTSRGTPSNASYRNKNNSPTKSSPLASSPPTNASDLDDNSQSSQSHHGRDRRSAPIPPARSNGHTATTNGNTPNGVPTAKKRPADSQTVSSQVPAKKARVTKDVLDKAHKFDKFYEKYRILHDHLNRLANPPREALADLIDMRDRLVNLKAEIRREVEPAA